ncbi:hypothetical protein ACFSUD_18740 [Sulfitobacter aestuarii]|uniref:Methyltransferase domain-containing protein n=1 Tax=Sulfitobacter aestuarii TaxID=2161676 RepID=A0ABW5U7Q9_9RHOB
MTSNIAEQKITAMRTQHDIATSFSNRSLFWKSNYLVDSSFLHHVSFAFWIAEMARPASVVELGIDDGQCYFTFCQAIERMNLAARCLAYSNPEHAHNFSALQAYNSRNYDYFSRISEKELHGALFGLHDQATDILIVNVAQMSDSTLGDIAENWTAKLTDRGMVLLYNYSEGSRKEWVRNILKNATREVGMPCVFDTGDDLSLILYGENADARLRQLVELEHGSTDYNHIRAIFRRLGEGHFNEYRDLKKMTGQKKLKKANKKLIARIRKLENKIKKASSESHVALGDLNHTINTLTRQHEEQRHAQSQEAEALAQICEEYKAEVAAYKATIEEKDTDIDTVTGQINALQGELRSLKVVAGQSAEIHQREVIALTKIAEDRVAMITDLRTRADRHVEELHRLTQASVGWQTEITQLRSDNDRLGRDLRLATEQKNFSERYRMVELKLRDLYIDRLQAPKRERARRERKEFDKQITLVATSSCFDSNWYLEAYPDVRAAGVDPARHFVLNGLYEGRKPNPTFDTVSYYIKHPDALEEELNPVAHKEIYRNSGE